MTIRTLRECIELMLEMPHLDVEDANIRLRAGVQLLVIDFRIEHMSIAPEQKRQLMRAFNETGFVGDVDGEMFVFKRPSDSELPVRPATEDDLLSLPMLPDEWYDVANVVTT